MFQRTKPANTWTQITSLSWVSLLKLTVLHVNKWFINKCQQHKPPVHYFICLIFDSPLPTQCWEGHFVLSTKLGNLPWTLRSELHLPVLFFFFCFFKIFVSVVSGPLRSIMKDLHSDDNEDESEEPDDNDNDSELERPVNTRGGSRSRRWVSFDGR